MTLEPFPQLNLAPLVVNINNNEVESENNLVFNSQLNSNLSIVNNTKNLSDNFSELQYFDTPHNQITSSVKETINDSYNTSICDKLRNWMVQFKISHNGANSLLNILRTQGIEVPKDVRTLMNTPKTKEITKMSNGSYIHLGLRNMLLPLLEINNANIHISDKIIKLGINIDGLPIAKSSKSQLWPILISILNFKKLLANVIPIGIFHGCKKPQSVEEFLNLFIIDLLEVLESGLSVNGTMMTIDISNIVCDAPAKSFLLQVKCYNAYFGCSSCIEEGDYLQNRVCFLGTNAPLRTDETFRNKSNEEYHKGDSPLLNLPINITNVVSLDYMHCVCLGVVKRLIQFWVSGKKNIRLTDDRIERINSELKNLRPYVPSEFCRLPRPIDEIEFWKATELRSFVFYSGAIVLNGKLKPVFYKHFLLLVFATRILASPDTCYKYNSKASEFLIQFVNDYGLLYGHHFVTYNVHSLVHLPMFTLLHGPLDNYSSFRYENYLQYLKKSLKSERYPLQEIYNRIIEKQQLFNSQSQLTSDSPIVYNEIINSSHLTFLSLSDKIYRKCILKSTNTTIDVLKEKDNFFLCKDNSLVTIQHIIKPKDKPIKFIVNKYLNVSEFCENPISSFVIGMFLVNTNELSDAYCLHEIDLKYKCFFVKVSHCKAVISSLCHEILL